MLSHHAAWVIHHIDLIRVYNGWSECPCDHVLLSILVLSLVHIDWANDISHSFKVCQTKNKLSLWGISFYIISWGQVVESSVLPSFSTFTQNGFFVVKFRKNEETGKINYSLTFFSLVCVFNLLCICMVYSWCWFSSTVQFFKSMSISILVVCDANVTYELPQEHFII